MILNQACAKYAIDVDSSQKYTVTISAYDYIVAYIILWSIVYVLCSYVP